MNGPDPLPTTTSKPGPYVGPRPFQVGETLFGRNKEKIDLFNLLRARRVILLYSPSGAGKTSLIQAGLIPQLKKDYLILPVIRINELPPVGEDCNRYLYSALSSLERMVKVKERLSGGELASLSRQKTCLSSYLRGLLERLGTRAKSAERRALLIFDQFEEILTLDPVNKDEKTAFFADLEAVLNDYSNYALFAMREDYIAGLDPFLGYFPDRLNARFRLDMLSVEAAIQAIQAPALSYKTIFEDDAAWTLARDLSRINVQEANQLVMKEGPSVEPVQLQVVCKYLWDLEREDRGRITLKDYSLVGSVENALRNYYNAKISEVAKETGKHEIYLREWIENQLITPQRLRNQVAEGSEAVPPYHLDARTVYLLSNAYLVRMEKRRGVTWYELTHDRLVEPILQANTAWREKNHLVLRTPAELGTDLEDTGWGIIFPAIKPGEEKEQEEAKQESILKALKPLLDRRQAQAQQINRDRFRVFTGDTSYRFGESPETFLQRNGAGNGYINPDKMPYYLLLVGSPQKIPFDFQYALNVQYSVGRIDFETLEEYENYARSVDKCESGGVHLPNRAAIFAPMIPNDMATRSSLENLAAPLCSRLAEACPNWQVEGVLAEQAKKARLKQLMGGADCPAILLAVSYAMPYRKGEPDTTTSSGAIVCQDWPGPRSQIRIPTRDMYFSGQDLDQAASALGLVAFLWGSYTGGTPLYEEDRFVRLKLSGAEATEPEVVTPFPILAQLPQRLLSHPAGGALAVIGLTGLGWTHAFEGTKDSHPITIFDYTLTHLMQGYTAGKAMNMIKQRSNALSAQLLERMKTMLFYPKEKSTRQESDASQEFTRYFDSRNFILIGDPAVRLPVDPLAVYQPPEAGWQRPAL